MSGNQKEKVPIKEGMWEISPSGEANLIGSKCLSCGELYFPAREEGVCTHCQQKDLEKVELSNRGTISSFTVVYQQPAGGFYKGPVPYAYGFVELPEGIKVETLFTGCDLEQLEVGMEVALVIEELFEEDGKDILTYKFKPV